MSGSRAGGFEAAGQPKTWSRKRQLFFGKKKGLIPNGMVGQIKHWRRQIPHKCLKTGHELVIGNTQV